MIRSSNPFVLEWVRRGEAKRRPSSRIFIRQWCSQWSRNLACDLIVGTFRWNTNDGKISANKNDYWVGQFLKNFLSYQKKLPSSISRRWCAFKCSTGVRSQSALLTTISSKYNAFIVVSFKSFLTLWKFYEKAIKLVCILPLFFSIRLT